MSREAEPAPDRQRVSPAARLPHRGMQLASAAESAHRHQRTGPAPSRHAKTHAAGSASQFSVTWGDVADKDASGLLQVAVSEVLLTKVTPAIGRRAASVVARAVSARPATGSHSSRSIEGGALGDGVLAAATPDDHLHLPARRLEAASDDRHLASAPGVGPRPPAGGTSGRAWALRRPGSGVESTPEPGCSRGRNCDARLTSVHWCDPAHSNSRFWLDSAGGSH